MRKFETKSYLKLTENYYGLNTFWTAEQTTLNGIPIFKPSDFIPKSVFQFRSSTISVFKKRMLPDCACHFFTDDYRFVSVWNRPKQSIKLLHNFSAVFSPDFTLSFDFPDVINKWNHYRKMWVSAWWRSQGLHVIPVANWLDERSYSWCFEGMPLNSVIGLSAQEIYEPYEISLFLKGFKEMERLLKPKLILMIGGKRQLSVLEKNTYCPILYFAPR